MVIKAAAIYSIFVGLSMLGIWIMFYVTGSIPELETEPARILLHLAAEGATALALVAGGVGLLGQKRWGPSVYLLATGALLYTLIQSPGYYLHLGEMAFVFMFALLLVLTLLLLAKMLKES